MKLFFTILLFFPSITFGNMVITEVMCNPAGSDTDGEWVKIENIGAHSVDITGWKFNDGSNHSLNVPPVNGGVGDMTLEGSESALLANKASEISGASTIIDTVMSLSNSGDTLKLIDTEGVEVHTITYTDGDVIEGESCFSYDSNATTTTGATSTILNNIITTVNEVTKYRTVEIQPPQDIYVRNMSDISVFVGSTVYMYFEVYDSIGKSVSAQCHIAFGDGSSAEICNTSHHYEFPGLYTVSSVVSKNSLQDTTKFAVEVVGADVYVIIGEKGEYIEIFNNTGIDAELNGWYIKVGHKKFMIPEHTVVLANGSIKISANIMNIDIEKYGGVVEVFNAFGTIVADSNDIVIEAVAEESLSIASQEKTDVATSVLLEEVPQTKKSEVISKSVIGTIVTKVQTSDAAVEEVVLLEAVPQLAAVSMHEDSQDGAPIASFFPQGFSKWLVGLLALLGLAGIPLFLRDVQEGEGTQNMEDVTNSDSAIDEEAIGFTIEEIK